MRFGLVHRIMTTRSPRSACSRSWRAVSSTWTTASSSSGLVLALAVRSPGRRKPAMRHLATRAASRSSPCRADASSRREPAARRRHRVRRRLQIIRLATRGRGARSAGHRARAVAPRRRHGARRRPRLRGCFVGVLVVAPGALVLSHLRREVEGNYRQGARDRTGLPVDVPRILRSRRVVGRGFLATTCLLSVPIFLFTAALFVMFPRVGLLAPAPQPADRMIGFSDKVDLGEVGVLRDRPDDRDADRDLRSSGAAPAAARDRARRLPGALDAGTARSRQVRRRAPRLGRGSPRRSSRPRRSSAAYAPSTATISNRPPGGRINPSTTSSSSRSEATASTTRRRWR
jgi:hypothetical protein